MEKLASITNLVPYFEKQVDSTIVFDLASPKELLTLELGPIIDLEENEFKVSTKQDPLAPFLLLIE